MKFFALCASVFALSASLVSCQKDSPAPEVPEVHVFHVELDATVADTKASYASATRAITFESGDALYVVLTQPTSATWSNATGTLTYNGTSFNGDISYSGTYDGSDIIKDAKDLSAIFLPKDYGTVGYLSAMGVTTATKAFYAGTKDAAVPQLVHLTASVSDQAGNAKSPIALTANNAVLFYTITADALSAGSHTVSVSNGNGTTISGSVTAVAETATTFAVAFPADATERTYTLSIPGYNAVAKSGKALTAGKVANISTTVTVNNAPLSGVFSVSPTKTVKFAKGNLTRDNSKWAFLSNSWEYNTSAANDNKVYTEDGAQHFQWVIVFQSAGSGNSAVVDGIKTDLGSGWRGLSFAEWGYLLGDPVGNQSYKRTVSWHYYAKISGASVGTGDKRYLLIFPDSFNASDWNATMGPEPTSFDAGADNSIAYTEDNFMAMQSAGIVILPAAGSRHISDKPQDWYNVGNVGYYWSSTSISNQQARSLCFQPGMMSMVINDKGPHWFSVRLVQDYDPNVK